ncbi:hypothetical protein GGS26DRAFT_1603 [Hypomontagnella submonticulosa]|nr:hypothetical protein GGS26DRAFT_1603 [Hypomontagnella submonticulosa]
MQNQPQPAKPRGIRGISRGVMLSVVVVLRSAFAATLGPRFRRIDYTIGYRVAIYCATISASRLTSEFRKQSKCSRIVIGD